MQVHDDLAALLARNLTLGPIPISAPAPVPVQVQPEQPKIVYAISQHYHHSAHVVKSPVGAEVQEQAQKQHVQQDQSMSMSQEPEARSEQRQTPEDVLIQNGIDPAALTPVQLALFKMSALDRRDYLLQLWRICPPTRTAADYNPVAAASAWGTIEVELEKEIASSQIRVQQKQQQATVGEEVMSLDGTPIAVSQPTSSQSDDGRWLQSVAQGYMEPYMATGYEELARREYMTSTASVPRDKDAVALPGVAGVQLRYSQAMDPVYDNRLATSPGRSLWPQQHQSAMDMENQYGALMAMREGCEMEM